MPRADQPRLAYVRPTRPRAAAEVAALLGEAGRGSRRRATVGPPPRRRRRARQALAAAGFGRARRPARRGERAARAPGRARGCGDARRRSAGSPPGPARSLVGRDRPRCCRICSRAWACLVSGDTGVAHLAAALGVAHRHALRAHRPAPAALRAVREGARARRPGAPCAPCFLRRVPDRARLHARHRARTAVAARGAGGGGMKAVLHTEASPGLGGQELRTLDEARWIAERGWRVLLAVQPRQPPARARAGARRARRWRCACAGPWDLAAVRALVRLIRAERVSARPHAQLDRRLARRDGRALGAGAGGPHAPRVDPDPPRAGIRCTRRLADRVITSGEAIRRARHRGGRRGPSAWSPSPPGVALEAFDGPRTSAETLESAGRGREARRSAVWRARSSGSVAMFRGSKGHDHLLDAFARLHAQAPRRAPAARGRRHPARLGGRAGARAGARRRGGASPASGSDVPALLAAMDCFALASTRTEGVPQSLLQAVRGRCPAGGEPRSAASPRWCEDGVTGLLVPPEDPAALAAAIERGARRSRRGRARARAPPASWSRSASRTCRRSAGCSRSTRSCWTGRRGVTTPLTRAPPGRQPLVDGQRRPGDPPGAGPSRARAPRWLGLIAGDRFEAKAREAGIEPIPGLSLEREGRRRGRGCRDVRAAAGASCAGERSTSSTPTTPTTTGWGWLAPRVAPPSCARSTISARCGWAGRRGASTGATDAVIAVSGQIESALPARGRRARAHPPRGRRGGRRPLRSDAADADAVRARAGPRAGGAARPDDRVRRPARPEPRPRAADPRLPALLGRASARPAAPRGEGRGARAPRGAGARARARERVIFTGYRDADLPAVLRALDAFVLMGAGSDESCRAALEAMAAGRPVVARRVGALPGRREPRRDRAAARRRPAGVGGARAAAPCSPDPARARAMGEAGGGARAAEFSPERHAERGGGGVPRGARARAARTPMKVLHHRCRVAAGRRTPTGPRA